MGDAEVVECTVTRQLLEKSMSKDEDEQTEIEAATERLKGFIKKPVKYHDSERMRRVQEGREYEPHRVSWRELARYTSRYW